MVVGKRNPPRSNRGRRSQEASPEQPSSTSGAPAAEAPVVLAFTHFARAKFEGFEPRILRF